MDELPGGRAIHTVSAFFPGILIESAMFGDDHLYAAVDNDDGFTFHYLWFLTCLYHDIGYRMNVCDRRFNAAAADDRVRT
jgi:hypothetical protein